MPLFIPLLSVGPRLAKRSNLLVATTPWRLRILTLGCFWREVLVDPNKKDLIIRRTYLWFFSRRRRVPFKKIQAVTYSYQDWSFSSLVSWAYNTSDVFAVGLRLFADFGDDEVHLFSFFGEGSFINEGPIPDWLMWDGFLLDLSGTQQRESRTYVELLSKMIGVRVIPGRA